MSKFFENYELEMFLIKIYKFYKELYITINYVDIKTEERKRPYPEIRAVFSILSYEIFNKKYSQEETARVVNRDHSNFRAWSIFVENMYQTDKNFKKNYDNLKIICQL
jgi:hypothetical protein